MTIFDLTIDGRSYDEMSAEEQTAFEIEGAFTSQERDWFETHWLKGTASDVTAINAALPSNTRVYGLPSGDDRYMSSDLLTDCGIGDTYDEAGSLIRALPIVAWSPPDE